eukprot:gene9075-9245_t
MLAADLLHKAGQGARQGKGEAGQVVKKQQSAGLHSFNQWAAKHLQDMDAEQHVLILDCMGAMAQAGIAPVLRSLQEGLLSSLADRGFLEDAATFLAVGQSLTSIDSVFMSGLGFPVLLSEPVLKKLFRDDADAGAGLVMEVLIGMQLAGVPVPAKCQDAVSKVLQEHLHRYSPPQLAALLACHTKLGLESLGRLLRRTAAEYLKRPVAAPTAEVLLGVLGGLAAGGSATVKELPMQLLSNLQDVSAAQHQPGLVTLLKELQAIQDGQLERLQQASPGAVLRLVVGLQLEGNYRNDVNHEQLHEQLLRSLGQLGQPNSGEAASTAGGTPATSGDVSPARQILAQFSVPELAVLVAAVVASGPNSQKGSATSNGGTSNVELPHGSAELSVLLQALLENEVLLQVHAVDNAAARDADGGSIAEHRAAGIAPVTFRRFSQQDWTGLARLVKLCVEWYPTDLPPQLVQLVLEVVAVQAQQETVTSCNADAAVNLLWSAAVSGSLSLDLWDALAVALDQPGAALQSQQLQQVFEAYCLVVLRIGGPAPRPPPAGQLAAAADAYWNAVVAPAGADRTQLLEVLSASGVVPPGRPLTSLHDGHLLLFDMLVPGLEQLVTHLKASVTQGAALAPLPEAQMHMLRQIANIYKGPVVQEVPDMPHFGDARTQRLMRTAAAAQKAAEDGAGSDEAEDAVDYDPNSMDAQELFLHNRVWLTTEDPWWFSQRLLVQPTADTEPGGDIALVATGAGGLSIQNSAPASKLTGDGWKAAKAAAAAALVTLLSALEQLSATLQQQEVKAMLTGKEVRRGDGEVNGKLVSICRKLAAYVDAAAGAVGAAAAGMGYGFAAGGDVRYSMRGMTGGAAAAAGLAGGSSV